MKALNNAGKDSVNNRANKVDVSGDNGLKVRKKVSLQYVEGRSEAGLPTTDGVEGVRDLSGKTPYGRSGMGWAEKSGKLGDLDPYEKDMPNWVGTWSECLVGEGDEQGPNGAGITLDENYYVPRPRTFSRQEKAFKDYNPEFQDVADQGDWTSLKWDRNV